MNPACLKRCISSYILPESAPWELQQSVSLSPRPDVEYSIYNDTHLPCPIKQQKYTINTLKSRPNRFSASMSFKVCKKPVFNPVLLSVDKNHHRYSKSSTAVSVNERTNQYEISVGPEISDGLPISAFVSRVDPYFICNQCYKVANKPLECSLCEILVCKYCSNDECPDCHRCSLRKPSKYVKLVYKRLQIKCKNCSFHGSIKSFNAHKCMNMCQSSICQTYTNHEFCSHECRTVTDFSRSIPRTSRIELLQMFLKLIQKPDGFLERRRNLREELKIRRCWYHFGTWNKDTWTCCHRSDKYSYGCTSLE